MGDTNQKVQVTIIANVQSLLSGLKEAQESMEGATAGIKGNLGALSDSLGNLGATALVLGALGLAFETIKEGASFIGESVKQTYELSETFESLQVKMGLTLDQLNAYNASLMLTGSSVQDFSGWQRGATMSMRSNADMLVQNGIAANQAALLAMPFTEYLQKVVEKAEQIEDPGRKAVFLQEALGRSGLDSYLQIKKFVDALGDGQAALERYGGALSENMARGEQDMEKATGQLNLALQGLKGMLTDVFGAPMTKAKENMADFVANWVSGVRIIRGADPNDAIREQIKKLQEEVATAQKNVAEKQKATAKGATIVTKEELQQQQQIREQHSQFLAKMAESDLQTQLVANQTLLEQHKITTKEKEDLDRDAYAQTLAAELHALDVQAEGYRSDPVKHAAALDQKRMVTAKYYADIAKLHDQTAKAEAQQEMQDHKLAADSALAAERFNVQNRIQIAKGYYDWLKAQDRATPAQVQEAMSMIRKEEQAAADQQRALDRAVAENKRDAAMDGVQASLDALSDEEAAGLITKQQLIQQEMAYEQRLFAIKLQEAQDAAMAEPDPVKHQQALNKIEALERQHQAKMSQLDRQGAADRRATYDKWFSGLTSGFDNAISGLVKGTMTWGDAFRSILASMADFLIQQSEQMAMKWVADRLYEMLFGKATRAADVTGAASVYAVNAAASVAAIPVVGWAMAPGVMAEAFAAGMAFLPSAAGGWDRVPQDTLAMIHKDEKVLPADKARAMDAMLAGGGRGEVHHHHYTIQALDAQSFDTFLRRNQGTLVKVSNEAMRNRRTKP